MKIDCYFSKACSSKEALRNNILESMKREGIDASVHFHRIDEEEAQALGLMGSPSICIDGADVLLGEISGFA